MSLELFHTTLVANANSIYNLNLKIGNWYRGGDFNNLTDPTMLWHKGSTYAVAYEDNATFNQVWILKQTGIYILPVKVGVGTTGSEPQNHPTPALHIDPITDYVYVTQNQFHVSGFRLWKSKYPEMGNPLSETDLFNFVGTFDTNGAYLITLDRSNTNSMRLITRSGDAGSNGYNQSILTVDYDTASYSKLQVTNADWTTNQVRHYPSAAYFHGTSEYRVGFINHRKEASPFNTFKSSVWIKKLTDNVIHNISLSYSKDVGSSGALTAAELEANYAFKGTDSNQSATNMILSAVQINNHVYICYLTDTGQYIEKWLLPSSTLIAIKALPWTAAVTIKNGGNKLVLLSQLTEGPSVYTLDFDLITLKFKRTLFHIPNTTTFGIPENFLDVDGKYLIVGDSVSGDLGNVPLIITDEQWN